MKMLLNKSWIFMFLLVFTVVFLINFGASRILESGLADESNFTASLVQTNIFEDLDLLEAQEPQEGGEIYEAAAVVEFSESQKQEILDDIAEKLDIIRRQINDLSPQNSKSDENLNDQNEDELEDKEGTEAQEPENPGEDICSQVDINTALIDDLDKLAGVGPVTAKKIIDARPFSSIDDLLRVSGLGQMALQKIKDQGCGFVGAGASPPVFSGSGGGGAGGNISGCVNANNILISEFQVEGETANDDWVELYNPNGAEACLNGWSLQKASITGKISHIKNFVSGAKIPAKSYYLIVNNGASQDLLGLADMQASGLELSAEFSGGNTIYLVSKKDEIADGQDTNIIDKVGYGLAKDFEGLPALKALVGKSTGRIWDEAGQTYADTGNNSIDFEIDEPTPKAKNIKWIELPPAPSPEPKDETPPEVTFALDALQTQLSFDVSFTIEDPVSTVTPSGLESYIFRWKEGEGEWFENPAKGIDGAPLSVDVTETVSGSDGQIFYFQVKATDLEQNESDWLPLTPAETKIEIPVPLKNILINEIQIAPIGQRFVELYNPNGFEVDLTGWYIQRKTQNADSWDSFVSSANFDAKIIPADGYFLISRELADSDILIDITLSDNNSLALKNSDREIVDQLGWGQAQNCEGFCALNAPESKSITRNLGIDTNDNSADFTVSGAPSPKMP